MFDYKPPFAIKRDPRWTKPYWEYVLRLDVAARRMACYVPIEKDQNG